MRTRTGIPVWPFTMNRNSPQALGLVAWLPPTLGLGNQVVDMKSMSRLPAVNGALVSSDASMGAALVCDGTDDYAAVEAIDLGFNGKRTISVAAWCKPNDTHVLNGTIIAKHINYVPDQTYSTFYILFNNSKFLCSVQSSSSAQFPTWTTSNAVQLNTWHHVAFVFQVKAVNSSDMLVYVNGLPISTTFTPNAYNAAFVMTETKHNLTVGARFHTSYIRFFSGAIGDCRVYNRTLAAGEVAAMWHPATRWDLYWQPKRRYFYGATAGFVAAWAAHSNAQVGTGVGS